MLVLLVYTVVRDRKGSTKKPASQRALCVNDTESPFCVRHTENPPIFDPFALAILASCGIRIGKGQCKYGCTHATVEKLQYKSDTRIHNYCQYV